MLGINNETMICSSFYEYDLVSLTKAFRSRRVGLARGMHVRVDLSGDTPVNRLDFLCFSGGFPSVNLNVKGNEQDKI